MVKNMILRAFGSNRTNIIDSAKGLKMTLCKTKTSSTVNHLQLVYIVQPLLILPSAV
jgi:hypothetical protein